MAKNQFVKDSEFLARLDKIEREQKARWKEAKEDEKARRQRTPRNQIEQLWVAVSVLGIAVLYLLFS